ncbi:MAG TPA: HD domain-containing protein [Flavisolibacter sp.]|nr:HD domain-containing protein [Flavisolibacter sp.]
MTHSREVVQIARSVASALRASFKKEGINDFKLYSKGMNVVEAVCLSHDIGNPSFGHAGERILNDLMKVRGGYIGNAQTFRIINKLERSFPNQHGLLLSTRTLCGVVKYFKKGEINKKFLYKEDYESVAKIAS